MVATVVVLVVVVAAMLAGCLEGKDREEVTMGPAEGDSPTSFVVEEKIMNGDVATWTWSSSSPVTFLVQDTDGVVVYSRSTSTEDVGRVEATAHGCGWYRFTWLNELNETAVVRYEVLEEGAPGLTAPLALLAAAAAFLSSRSIPRCVT